jgi:hypothetical protein
MSSRHCLIGEANMYALCLLGYFFYYGKLWKDSTFVILREDLLLRKVQILLRRMTNKKNNKNFIELDPMSYFVFLLRLHL